MRLLNSLGALAPKRSPPESLRTAVGRCLALGRVKGKTLFFVITDLDLERDLKPLSLLRQMNHEVIVISPYTPFFEAHNLEGLDRSIYAISVSHQLQTRKDLLSQARALGIPVLDVGPDDLFPKLVLEVEELRRRGGS